MPKETANKRERKSLIKRIWHALGGKKSAFSGSERHHSMSARVDAAIASSSTIVQEEAVPLVDDRKRVVSIAVPTTTAAAAASQSTKRRVRVKRKKHPTLAEEGDAQHAHRHIRRSASTLPPPAASAMNRSVDPQQEAQQPTILDGDSATRSQEENTAASLCATQPSPSPQKPSPAARPMRRPNPSEVSFLISVGDPSLATGTAEMNKPSNTCVSSADNGSSVVASGSCGPSVDRMSSMERAPSDAADERRSCSTLCPLAPVVNNNNNNDNNNHHKNSAEEEEEETIIEVNTSSSKSHRVILAPPIIAVLQAAATSSSDDTIHSRPQVHRDCNRSHSDFAPYGATPEDVRYPLRRAPLCPLDLCDNRDNNEDLVLVEHFVAPSSSSWPHRAYSHHQTILVDDGGVSEEEDDDVVTVTRWRVPQGSRSMKDVFQRSLHH